MLFPLFLFLRLKKVKVVVTLHGPIFRLSDIEALEVITGLRTTFMNNLARVYIFTVYRLMDVFSNLLVVHSMNFARTLERDFGILIRRSRSYGMALNLLRK